MPLGFFCTVMALWCSGFVYLALTISDPRRAWALALLYGLCGLFAAIIGSAANIADAIRNPKP